MPKLAEPNLCTGCTACAAVCAKNAIVMRPDSEGFLHPAVDTDHCVGCGLCERVCPVLNPAAPTHTPESFAVKSTDEASRQKSTSGGVFPELAKDILSRGGAVFGAAYDDRFRVIHICAECEEEADRLRGAKYAQSDLGGSFREVRRRLDAGQPVLFSGTPCQCLGLKTFLRRDYENLLLVDLVCHSVPSPLAWEKYLEYICDGKSLTAVNLRCKDTGWSRYRYSNRFDFADGSSRMDLSGESLYMKLFGGGYITRPACTSCPAKGYARVSDLTLGDFWGIWDIDPKMDDDKGTSLVLVHSEKGRSAMEFLTKREVTLEEASQENPALVRAATVNPMRMQVMEHVCSGNLAKAAQLLPIPAASSRSPGFLHRFLRFLKRNTPQ